MRLGATPLNKYYEYDIAPLLRLFLLVVLFTQSGFEKKQNEEEKEEEEGKNHTINVCTQKISGGIDRGCWLLTLIPARGLGTK